MCCESRLTFERLIPQRRPCYPIVLDAGCGQGKSFRLLIDHFSPQRLIGVDAEEKCLQHARVEALKENIPIELRHCDIAALDVGDNSVDLVFCHQTFHHLSRQQLALEQIFPCSNPAAIVVRRIDARLICSWMIRLLFRHPMHVQRSAAEYQADDSGSGFYFWLREGVDCLLMVERSDLGTFEWFGFDGRRSEKNAGQSRGGVKPD